MNIRHLPFSSEILFLLCCQDKRVLKYLVKISGNLIRLSFLSSGFDQKIANVAFWSWK